MPRRAPGGGPLATPVYSQRRRQRGGSRHERKAWKKTAVSCCCHCGRGHRGSVPRYVQQNFLVEFYLLRGALGRHESGFSGSPTSSDHAHSWISSLGGTIRRWRRSASW